VASVVKNLPKGLTPWSAWLQWFAPELAIEVGQLLQRLQPLLGPFKDRGHTGEPDWDGLDDLRTRGSYERLLTSEWLLADEVPEEFLRRAASGEHMFLTPRPLRRRSQRTIIALFDAGPLQLGAPRLAHIALWILLARRAVQVQGQMRWGVLQTPGELLDASDVHHLKALLGKRSFTTPNEQHLNLWLEALDSPATASGERWLIGSPYLNASPASFTHRVRLHKELDGQALEVSLLERGSSRKVSLPLPNQTAVAPLLQGSFEPVLGQQPTMGGNDHEIALTKPPIIAIDGTRVGVLHRDIPAISTVYIPRSPEEDSRVPRLHRWSYNYSVVCATLVGKSLGVLLSDHHLLRFWPTSMTLKPRPPQDHFNVPFDSDTSLPAVWLRGSQSHRLCVIDRSRRLMRWNAAILTKRDLATEPQLHLVTENALALVQLSNDIAAFAYHAAGAVWFARINTTHEPHDGNMLIQAPSDTRVIFGRGCFIAIQLSADTWRIRNWNDHGQSYDARLPSNLPVIGVLRDADGRVGLLSLDDRNLRLHCHDGTNLLLYTAPAQIASHSVCPNSGLVAMLTTDKQLIAFSAATQQQRLFMLTGRKDDDE
jgi:hypothetical protein